MNLTRISAGSLTRSEPYLWLHLAGAAALPLCLELCLIGLRASESWPTGLVGLLVAIAGIGPVVWMQWQRPFCIFSLVVLALKPEQLSETQRRILAQFKAPLGRIIAVGGALLALLILRQLTQWSLWIRPVPVAGGSLGGLLLAAGSFLFANLLLQVPASVLPVLLTPDAKLTSPYPTAKTLQDFILIGLRVNQILPVAPAKAQPASAAPAAAKNATAPQEPAPVMPVTSSALVEALPVEEPQATGAPVAEAQPVTASELSATDRVSSPLISIPIPAAAVSSNPASWPAPEPQPELQPEPRIIHSLAELIPPATAPNSAPNPPQANRTIITIVTSDAPRDLSDAALAPVSAPAEPHVQNTIVRILL